MKISGILIVALFFAGSLEAAGENSCVTCHQSLTPSPQRAHDFDEWRKSPHAEKSVTCDKCHGGNPSATDVKKAHEGIIKSGDSKSPLYFSKIPETCGQCHQAELEAFQKSFHYRELKRTGHGPNCLTCHGSMATKIPEPQQLEQGCSYCHSQRTDAQEALVTLNLAGQTLTVWEKQLRDVEKRGLVTPEQKKAWENQHEAYRDVQGKWHSFDLKEVIRKARDIVSIAKKETQSLRLKKRWDLP